MDKRYIYIVTDKPNVNIPVYKVEREDGEGGERMLHRNNLLHLGSSLADEVKEPDKNKSSGWPTLQTELHQHQHPEI